MADIIRDHDSLIGPYVPTEERSFLFSLEGSEICQNNGRKIYEVKVHTLYLTKYFKIVININLYYFSVQNLKMSLINNSLSAILYKHILTGLNYHNWLNLKIVLNSERITYTLEKSSLLRYRLTAILKRFILSRIGVTNSVTAPG